MSKKELSESVKLVIKVSPKSSMNKLIMINSVSDEIFAFKALVTAVPEHGKANEAVINLLSKELGFAKSRFSIIQGHTARMKTILVQGDKKEVLIKLHEFKG